MPADHHGRIGELYPAPGVIPARSAPRRLLTGDVRPTGNVVETIGASIQSCAVSAPVKPKSLAIRFKACRTSAPISSASRSSGTVTPDRQVAQLALPAPSEDGEINQVPGTQDALTATPRGMAVLDVELQPGRAEQAGPRYFADRWSAPALWRSARRWKRSRPVHRNVILKLGSDASRRGCRFRCRLDGLEIDAEVNDGTDVDRPAARQGEPERPP